MYFLYKTGALWCPYLSSGGTKAEQLKDMQEGAVFSLSGKKCR